MRPVARSAWMLKGSNNSSIESMREDDEKHRRLAGSLLLPASPSWVQVTVLALISHLLIIWIWSICNNEDDHALPEPEERLECNGNTGITSPVLSDASMASNPAPTQSEPVASA
ncbi:hypothetical protein EDB19DRAFT_1832035 [Suillus lakei]|nr:hypothetical protein EDB19DRAFT_1832035 [Suillus lakei]